MKDRLITLLNKHRWLHLPVLFLLLLYAIPLLIWAECKDEWQMLTGQKARPPYDPEKDDWYP